MEASIPHVILKQFDYFSRTSSFSQQLLALIRSHGISLKAVLLQMM